MEIIIKNENGLWTLTKGDEQLFSGKKEALINELPNLVAESKVTQEESNEISRVLDSGNLFEDILPLLLTLPFLINRGRKEKVRFEAEGCGYPWCQLVYKKYGTIYVYDEEFRVKSRPNALVVLAKLLKDRKISIYQHEELLSQLPR